MSQEEGVKVSFLLFKSYNPETKELFLQVGVEDFVLIPYKFKIEDSGKVTFGNQTQRKCFVVGYFPYGTGVMIDLMHYYMKDDRAMLGKAHWVIDDTSIPDQKLLFYGAPGSKEKKEIACQETKFYKKK